MARPPKKNKSSTQRRAPCRCNCGRNVTQSTERRHRAGKAAPHVLAAAITRRHELGQDSDTDASDSDPNQSDDEMSISSDASPSVISDDGRRGADPAVIQDAAFAAAVPEDDFPSHSNHNSSPRHNPIDLEEHPSCLLDDDDQDILRNANIHLDDAVNPRTWRRTTVEDYDSDDDSDNEDPEPEGDLFEWEADLGDLYDVPPDELSDEDILPGNTMEEEYEQLLAAFQEDLTDKDLALLRQFSFKVEERISDESYAKLSFVFPGTTIYPFKVACARAAFLAEFRPVPYDCCINSCCCYTGSLSKLNVCPYCGEDRFDSLDRPRKRFNYIPLIPRLQGYYRNRKLAEQMQYRHQHRHDPTQVNDVLSGCHYARLRKTRVTVNGVERPYMFFSDRRDLLLGMSTDGFAPFRRRKKTCWPLIIFNYNLPPEVRFHLINILCIGVIPGPKKPKDFDSFVWPLVKELLQLALGVRSFDILSNEVFALRAYLVLVFGDIPAVSMVMRIKGHNGVHPCRMCKIRGLRIPDARSTVHYVPLHSNGSYFCQRGNTCCNTAWWTISSKLL
ncbi:hypothetical protein ONZ45_g15275 [Pleurotus djamor]|nr:hypothetical protein ONZ45_g15275 [Pleurotus djamor]